MRSDTVELKHIIDEFHRVSLAHSDINFLFYNNGNELFDLSVNKSKKRICSIFGTKWDNYLIPISETTSLTNLDGFIVKPEFFKEDKRASIFLLITVTSKVLFYIMQLIVHLKVY